jgi:hypothetical protein
MENGHIANFHTPAARDKPDFSIRLTRRELDANFKLSFKMALCYK